jgi:hypothetical protein
MDWTKIIATVAGALILALQGTNIVQGVAISGTENRIERVEEDLAKSNLELNKLIVSNQETFRKYAEQNFDVIEKKLTDVHQQIFPSPTPKPNQ